MEVVHVVMAQWDYEGGSAVRAFGDAGEAEAFAATCRDYQHKRPVFPGDGAEVEAWANADNAWIAAHPAGRNYSADDFKVVEVPFGAAPAHPGEGEKPCR